MFSFRRGSLLLLTLALVLTGLLGCSGERKVYNEKSFDAAVEGITDSQVLAGIYRQYLTETTDTDLAEKIELEWFVRDKEAALAAVNQLAELNPDSPHYIYLQGWMLKSAEEKVMAGRKAIALDLKFAHGYKLIGGAYQSLFRDRGNEEDLLWLERQLETDSPIFHQAVMIDPGADWAWSNLYGFQKYNKNEEEALVILLKGKDLNMGFASDWNIASMRMELGQYDEALQEFVDGAAKALAEEEIEASEQDEYIFVRYTALLQRDRLWSHLDTYVKSHAGWEAKPGHLVVLAGAKAIQLDMDTALAHLNAAAENGLDSESELNSITGIDVFAQDERYLETLALVQANWIAGAPERKAETLADKFSRPAPLWTLGDAVGDSISLTSLKGEIIILDFWATWCGPCRMAMPVLDHWMKNEMPEGVRVFSVNVWENNLPGATEFIASNDYAMELLFGSHDLASNYGVEGIPYICAIDAEGNIRFEEVGFSDGLGEKLGWWVEELSQ